MAKETSARIAKIAGRALDNPYNISGAEIKALAASALAQREADAKWPTWKELGYKTQQLLMRRWHINDSAYRDIRLTAMRIGKATAKLGSVIK